MLGFDILGSVELGIRFVDGSQEFDKAWNVVDRPQSNEGITEPIEIAFSE